MLFWLLVRKCNDFTREMTSVQKEIGSRSIAPARLHVDKKGPVVEAHDEPSSRGGSAHCFASEPMSCKWTVFKTTMGQLHCSGFGSCSMPWSRATT